VASPSRTEPRVPPERALPQPEVGASAVAGGAAAAGSIGAAAGAAAGVAATAPVVPLLKLGQETLEKLLEALTRFFLVSRARQESWLLGKARGRLPQQDILDLIAEENARQAAFERKARARVKADGARALQLPPEEREAALRGLMRRERTYARYRSEAMAVRALSALDRAVLRRESPQGAFWKLNPDLKSHTADCLAMAGKFWPWEVLTDFHPPTHSGCGCSLHSYREAVGRRWLRPGAVMDLRTAIARADAAKALLHERELREALVSARVVSAEELEAAEERLAGRRDRRRVAGVDG
jgi:hypothetical protein